MKKVGIIAVAALTALGLIVARAESADDVPLWAYLDNPPDLRPPPDDGLPRHVPGSAVAFGVPQLSDRFATVDWHPDEHPPMPEVVAHGRRPAVSACGFCHRPQGTGAPENASLAGLPRAYLVRQMQDYASGARSSAFPKRPPPALMIAGAHAVTAAEVDDAAAYFASLEPLRRIRVQEGETAPAVTVYFWAYAPVPGAPAEPLGRRIVELAENPAQFEVRDSHATFVAYVPRGAVARGEQLVKSGAGRTVPCGACHGSELRGTDDIPSIAGRSPTYVVRQLFEFKSGARRGTQSDPMRATVARLSTDDMIDLAAYLATLEP